MRVVIDTNVVVSSFFSAHGPPALIFQHWLRGAFKLVASEAILEEYRRVLGDDRSRNRHGFTADEIDDLIRDFRKLSVFVSTVEALNIISSDPDDNKFLECAVAGDADCIVSGDKHLLNLREYQGIQILPPAAFLLVLDQE